MYMYICIYSIYIYLYLYGFGTLCKPSNVQLYYELLGTFWCRFSWPFGTHQGTSVWPKLRARERRPKGMFPSDASIEMKTQHILIATENLHESVISLNYSGSSWFLYKDHFLPLCFIQSCNCPQHPLQRTEGQLGRPERPI